MGAAVRLPQTGHSYRAQHFAVIKDRNADKAALGIPRNYLDCDNG